VGTRTIVTLTLAALALVACAEPTPTRGRVVTFPTSSVGAEAKVLRTQVARFMERHPDIQVRLQRTPDAADQRHQLYVQWLNAQVRDPDVLQIDIVWTPEFAAAGWLYALERFRPELADFFPSAVQANRHAGKLYALPWFLDVGMLYYRTDLLPGPPQSQAELTRWALRSRSRTFAGLVFQAARYEGLVTVLLEYLTAYGAAVLDDEGRVVLDSPAARAALDAMRAALNEQAIVPRAVLGWQEEQTRFAFQNGRALFMRNWPYAFPLMQDPGSKVAGRFAVTAMPAAPGGRAAAALGGSQLAINAHSDQPEAAYALVEYLLEPAQMLERARVVGQFPARRSLYAEPALRAALPVPPETVLEIIEHAVARPATPVYAEFSDILQIHVHRCLSGQEGTEEALRSAARELSALLQRVGLAPEGRGVRGG
jgi:multiple sugar transport system substrate-binding protein